MHIILLELPGRMQQGYKNVSDYLAGMYFLQL